MGLDSSKHNLLVLVSLNLRNDLQHPIAKETELIGASLKPTAPETSRRIKTHNDADQVVSEQVQTDVTNWTDVAYSYSENGSLTSSVSSVQSVDYTFDYDNRIVSVDNASSFVEYLYDASGARVGRISGTTTNYFVIDYTDGLKRPLAETDSSGTVTRYYVWSGAWLLCHIEANGDVFYYHSDELGSTLALTDSSGSVTDRFAYMPCGYANRTGTTETPFRWLGGYGVYYDSATDLHLTLHRAYSSQMKRFIHPDPLGIDGGVNVYMWANMNPLWFIDPSGLNYVDINISGGYWLGGTVGIAVNRTGIYPYAGGGLVTPGAGIAIHGSFQDPSSGWFGGGQGSLGLSAQGGGSGDGGFFEFGLGTPGASITGAHMWEITWDSIFDTLKKIFLPPEYK